MVRLLLFQVFKHQIHRILEILIILTDLHGIDKFDERGKVLFLLGCLIMDVADESTIEQCLCLVPERIAALTITLGICHECGSQLQDILFTVDIGERIIMHGLVKIDCVEDFDPVIRVNKCISNLEQSRALRIRQNIGRMKLQQVRLNPEPGFTGTGAADDQYILVSGIGRILRTVAHHQSFCLCEDHIVLKDRIDEGLDVLRATPSGRTILKIMLKIFGILSPDVDGSPQTCPADQAHHQVNGIKARKGISESNAHRRKE